MSYFYGRITTHPVFLDELRRRGVEFACAPGTIDPRQKAEPDILHLRIRYPLAAHAEVSRLAAYSGAEIKIETLPIDMEGLAEAASGGVAQKNAALTYYHEFGLEAAATDAQRDVHRRALERLGAAWSRSIRQTVREAVGDHGSELGGDPETLL